MSGPDASPFASLDDAVNQLRRQRPLAGVLLGERIDAVVDAFNALAAPPNPSGRELYDAYSVAVGGKSAVTGAPLPPFEACPELVQRGWEAAARRAREGRS